MTPIHADPCPHRCCPEPDDAPPHEHPIAPDACGLCLALELAGDPVVHPLEQRANEIAGRKFGKDTRRDA